MMNGKEKKWKIEIKVSLWIVIGVLFFSGVTALPIETELKFLTERLEPSSQLGIWLNKVYTAVEDTNKHHRFLAYGTDWLAFAHIMLALLFVGVLRDPLRNKMVVQFGICCCLSILPFALVAGGIRGIPVFWRLIDCAFGVLGIIPLMITLRNIKKIEEHLEKYCWGL